MFFLCFLAVSNAYTYAIINAMTTTPTNRTKELAADFYRNRIYNPNSPGSLELYQGATKVLNMTSTMQFDLIIQAMDQYFAPNATHCDWNAIFGNSFNGTRFLIFMADSKWCGDMPYVRTSYLQTHMHNIYPIFVGSECDMFQMYHIYGPCVKPGCIYWRDYMTYTE